MDDITCFRGEFFFLSNFYPAKCTYDGLVYTTSEHAYQSAKTVDVDLRKKFQSLKTPEMAKTLGKNVDVRPNWNKIRTQVMWECLQSKFSDPVLRQKLLDTGYVKIVEGNTWGDTFWGVCDGKGHNCLGIMLMSLRNSFRMNEFLQS